MAMIYGFTVHPTGGRAFSGSHSLADAIATARVKHQKDGRNYCVKINGRALFFISAGCEHHGVGKGHKYVHGTPFLLDDETLGWMTDEGMNPGGRRDYEV